MRYSASEKLEIIRIVEQSHLTAKRTLDTLGIPRTTFYRWYERYSIGGVDALEDRQPMPSHVWNRIPDDVPEQIVNFALEEPDLTPRELAVKFTDTRSYFVSASSVYRLLKALDLITSPAFAVIKAANAVPLQNNCYQPTVADGFYVSQGDRLGLVLSVNHSR